MGSSEFFMSPSATNNVTSIFKPNILSSSSSSDPPMEEWSSLLLEIYEKKKKVDLFERGLYRPDSGEVCGKYIALSDSDVLRHPYFKYPALTDPGIVSALCDPPPVKKYDTDGQELYLHLCDETEMAPVKLFHKGLLKTVINLRYYGVNPNGVRNMCLALAENEIVQRLDLTSSFLNNDACYHLGNLLANTLKLKELVLSQCRISYHGLMQLIPCLDHLKLDHLDLSKNHLGNEGIALIAAKITRGAKIKKLNLSYNDIEVNGAVDLANAFNLNKTCFTHLNLSWNFLYAPKAIKSLITSLYDNLILVELNLSWSGIKGGPFMADILMAKSLQNLDLSSNRLTAPAVNAIRCKLRTTKSLRVLNLSDNPLQPKEAYEMMRELRFRQVHLKELLMDEIAVTKEFPVEMKRILSMKHRAGTKITHGRIMNNYTLKDANFRDIVMKRLRFLGRKGLKKNRIDIAEYFLTKRKHSTVLIPRQMMKDMKEIGSKIDADLIEKLTIAFPGPRMGSSVNRAIDLEGVADYVSRLWPDAKAPPSPPPTVALLPPKPAKGKIPDKTAKGPQAKNKGLVKKKK